MSNWVKLIPCGHLSIKLCPAVSLGLKTNLKHRVELMESFFDTSPDLGPATVFQASDRHSNFRVSSDWKYPPLLRRMISSWPLTASTVLVVDNERPIASGYDCRGFRDNRSFDNRSFDAGVPVTFQKVRGCPLWVDGCVGSMGELRDIAGLP